MNATMDEQEIRGAVARMAAEAAAPALPGPAILAAGARRRVRRRAGAAGALALAATVAVSVSWPALAGGGSSAGPASGAPTTKNMFTDQLGLVLERVLPGAKVSAEMFTDTDPIVRHAREDDFPLRITYHGRVSEAFLKIVVTATGPDFKAAQLCDATLPWKTTRSDCTATDLAYGGIVHAELDKGPGDWNFRFGGTDGGKDSLTVLQADVYHGQTRAFLQVRGGVDSNDSGLTPAMLSTALQDPVFTSFLSEFGDHPERDPYGPLAPIEKTLVASGTAGTHKWSLSFAIISEPDPGDRTKIQNNCDYWEYTVDGKSVGDWPGVVCNDSGASVHNQPPTSADQPVPGNRLSTVGASGLPAEVIGTVLTSTVLPGTATVEATFDDQPAKLTAKVFTVHGDIPYFALVKPDPAKPDWKTATVRCLDANGKELGKLYFAAPEPPPTGQ